MAGPNQESMTQREKARQELEAWCRRYRQHLFPIEEETAEWLLSMVSRAVEGDELHPHGEFRARREHAANISFAELVLIHFTGEIVNIRRDEDGVPQRDENDMFQFERTGRKPPWLQAILEPDLDRPQ